MNGISAEDGIITGYGTITGGSRITEIYTIILYSTVYATTMGGN